MRLSSVLCVLFLAGCAQTHSPAEDLTFSAPNGWQESSSFLRPNMQYWRPSEEASEALLLIRFPYAGPDLASAVHQLDFQGLNTRVQIDSLFNVTICGNQPAIYLVGENFLETKDGELEKSVRMVVSNVNGATYVAEYNYPLGGEPNAEALAALRQLCAKK